VIGLCARFGYQRVTITQLSTRAGVSSATFYSEFNSKEACLLAAYQAAADSVLGEMSTTFGAGGWSAATRGALHKWLRAAQMHPASGRVLLVEARAAGPLLREERIRALERFEEAVDRFLDGPAATDETLDIPARALVGGVRSLVVKYLSLHAEDALPTVEDDLMAWIGSYAIPASRARFSSGPSAQLPETLSPSAIGVPEAMPRLPRGRACLPPGVASRSHRTRLIHATAEVMVRNGYADTTVSDIVAAAGVARDVFYAHFTDKQHAFLEAQQHPTQHILDECAKAFFVPEAWPQRVWHGLRTLLGLIVSNPALSHLRLVECYAAGPAAIRRAEEITRSFTVFLEEGYGYGPRGLELPRICSDAIAGAMFETIQRYIARDEGEALQRALPQLAYLAIAPFVGPQGAAALVQEMSAQA
jgi:AcrR family transcriptional regulator